MPLVQEITQPRFWIPATLVVGLGILVTMCGLVAPHSAAPIINSAIRINDSPKPPAPLPIAAAPSPLHDGIVDLCEFAHVALNMEPIPPVDREELGTRDHKIPKFFGVDAVSLTSETTNSWSRKIDFYLTIEDRREASICGRVVKLCSENDGVRRAFYKITAGPMSGYVAVYEYIIGVNGQRINKMLSFMTRDYALSEHEWGGECIERTRGKL